MTDSPSLDPEFYTQQIQAMQERYAVIFKRWKLSWNSYINDVERRLRNRKYWMWCYLVGLEKFIQAQKDLKPSSEAVEEDKNGRISRIVGDFYKNEQYIRSL